MHPKGSPAPAGIDPSSRGMTPAKRRFPRTRGDRPMHHTTTHQEQVWFPRTRGDRPDLLSQSSGDEVTGSPAPAGIDLIVKQRFQKLDTVPPHPRG